MIDIKEVAMIPVGENKFYAQTQEGSFVGKKGGFPKTLSEAMIFSGDIKEVEDVLKPLRCKVRFVSEENYFPVVTNHMIWEKLNKI
jgi:hypothetical protein